MDGDQKISVAALYRFARWPGFGEHRASLRKVAVAHGVKGTLLLASEGINGTIAGPRHGLDAVLAAIRAIPEIGEVDVKFSAAREMPFARLKVRLKKEIVTMGVEGIDPLRAVGTYVAPQDWNALISDPDTLLIDTRNAYEVGIGTFEGAEDPGTHSFREFPRWVEERLASRAADSTPPKRVAMFCTGGIRCEKATALVKALGVDEVYHLKGGILKYLEEVPQATSLWRGACYVFDGRVAVGHGLAQSAYKLCHACGAPVLAGSAEDGGGYVEGGCAACRAASPSA
ncbi:MAG TPA: rhodanese-related sulfurtransferase [Hyphomicrobiaceae bacterium]|nr:rhodanese-related sulfurtransferase [Hyphomicrobiaceae bacterium]